MGEPTEEPSLAYRPGEPNETGSETTANAPRGIERVPDEPGDPTVTAIRIHVGEPREDDSVKITIESSQQNFGDVDPYTSLTIEETKKKLEEIIHLEDGTSKVDRHNIKTHREILVYSMNQLTANQLPPTGEVFKYEPSRNDFVRKVFTIVFIMLLATSFYAGIVLVVEPLYDIYTNPLFGMILIIISVVILFIMNYVMTCSACSRSFPCNVICLVIVVMAMGTLCTVTVLKYKAELVILALFITTAVVGVCLALACTSIDFTKFLLYFIAIGAAFAFLAMGISIYMMMVKYVKTLHILILIGSTIMSVVSIIMELQMILGGKSVEIGVNDWAFAAYILYVSIVQLFLNLLRLLALLSDD